MLIFINFIVIYVYSAIILYFPGNMGRMHNGGKGISRSSLPYRRSVPTWLKMSSDDVTEQIVKLARKVWLKAPVSGRFEADRCHRLP